MSALPSPRDRDELVYVLSHAFGIEQRVAEAGLAALEAAGLRVVPPEANSSPVPDERLTVLAAEVVRLRAELKASRPSTERALREALELMLTHGEHCNWFAGRGDEEVVEQARAALVPGANGESSTAAADADWLAQLSGSKAGMAGLPVDLAIALGRIASDHAPGIRHDIGLVLADAVAQFWPKPRPLGEHTLEDYALAVSGEGPLAYTWSDKPHRLVYDLVSALRQADGAPSDYNLTAIRDAWKRRADALAKWTNGTFTEWRVFKEADAAFAALMNGRRPLGNPCGDEPLPAGRL